MSERHAPLPIPRLASLGLALLSLLAFWSCSAPPAPPKPEVPPVARAGPDQAVSLGTEVTLDASESEDPQGRPLTFRWTQATDNPAPVVLTDTEIVRFTPTAAGRYRFILVVSAGAVASDPDSVDVTVTGSANTPPVPRTNPSYAAALDALFFLDASASSDSDGDSLSFRWRVVSAPGQVTVEDTTAAQTRITPAVAGSYVFRVVVSDGVATRSAEVTVLATSQGNTAPVADAGASQTVAVGTPVRLDGSGSFDADDDPLTYRWSVGNNPGETVVLSDSTSATPQFVPNLLGAYVFGLVVSDGSSVSLRDTTVITVVAQTYARRAGMIEIPGGPFTMGSDGGQPDEAPPHTVELSTFWIDSVEVTTAQYTLCVNDGQCARPAQRPGCNFGLSERAEHPVNCVDYAQAASFCAWAGKRLPTEAEWEKAARGPHDTRRFPWGDEDPNLFLITHPDARLLNFNNTVGTTVPVGLHPDGVSPYGVHNLAGNVYEWVADWYAADYYARSPGRDPQGEATGQLRVARGGHFLAPAQAVTTTVRNATQPDTRAEILGFRCARTDPP